MMKIEDIILPAVFGLVGVWAFKKYVLDPTAGLGKAFAEQVIRPVSTSLKYPGAGAWALLHSLPLPDVPVTPAGYRPSNWSWDLTSIYEGVPTKLGLPEGMTPESFCALTPDLPLCVDLRSRGLIPAEPRAMFLGFPLVGW